MATKVFGIRVDTKISERFKALTAVLSVDSSQLFTEMIQKWETELDPDQKAAYNALLKAWKIEE